MKIKSCCITDPGTARTNNEDNFFLCGKHKKSPGELTSVASDIAKRNFCLYAVCDGMSGEENGEIASFICIDTIDHAWKEKTIIPDDIIKTANDRICKKIISSSGQTMGSTMVLITIKDDVAQVFNVGDSRAYLIRNKTALQISYDHTLINRLLRSGIITGKEAENHKDRHKLTQSLGIFEDEMIIEPFVSQPIKLFHGDKLLLCSDGLTDVVSDEEISSILEGPYEISFLAQRLIGKAKENGSADNITVLICQVD